MVPFRLTKMKWADAPFPPFPTGKDEVLVLLTWPVGLTPVPPGGMFGAVAECVGGVPDTLKRLAVLVPWFEVQMGLESKYETPQGFTGLGSMSSAGRNPSETRFA